MSPAVRRTGVGTVLGRPGVRLTELATAGRVPTVMAGDTTQRFLQSTGAAVFSQLWRVIITLGVMVLCRHLVPADEYGLWNWVLPLFMILGALRDMGLVYHVVRINPRPYGNLLLLEVGWGAVLALGALALAPVAAGLALNEVIPSTVPVLRIMVVFLFLEGLSSVPRVYFESELEVGRTVLPELVRNLAMATVTVSMVLAGHGIWAMVAGQIVAAGVYAALLWMRAWGRMPLTYLPGQNLALIRASLPLASIWLITVMSRFIDLLIVGWRFDANSIAQYGLAFKNACRLSEITVPALIRSLYPVLVAFGSGASANAQRLFETYSLTTVVMMALEVPSALFLFVNADLVVKLLAGASYADMAPNLLRILCFATLVDPLGRLGGELLKARHGDRVWMKASGITLLGFTVVGVWLTGRMGVEGMAWAKLFPLGVVIMGAAIFAIDPAGFRRLFGQLAFVYTVPIPLFAAAYWLGGDALWLRFGLSVVAGGTSVAICLAKFGPTFLRYAREAKAEAGLAVPTEVARQSEKMT